MLLDLFSYFKSYICKIAVAYSAASALTLPLSRRVVYARTGDLAFTLRANFTTRWLRRVPVRRGDVRFLGLPKVQTPVGSS